MIKKTLPRNFFYYYFLLVLFGFILKPSSAYSFAPLKADFIIAIDAGHSVKRYGAVSAHGKGEYVYNENIAKLLLQRLKKDGYVRSFIIDSDGRDTSLLERVSIANRQNANLLISIHHDSVQQKYLKEWSYKGGKNIYSDQYSGYSIFYSQLNPQYKKSLSFAKRLGSELLDFGFYPSHHHAEPIQGEERNLIDAERGIYRVDDFGIVKSANMPSIILECGVIVNREEEMLLENRVYQKAIVSSISSAVNKYFHER